MPITSSVNPTERLDRALTKAAEIDPDLARLVEAWPVLPSPIRRAMLALIETASPGAPGTPHKAAE